MENFDNFVIARALHVIGVVLWIGGVAFVTTVLIPAVRRIDKLNDRQAMFEWLEGRFGWQAKFTILLTGVTGFYMMAFMDAWDRYLQLEFWWVHLMTLVWVIFTLVLFVFEPLFLHQWFREQAQTKSHRTFVRLQQMHVLLLSLSLIAVFGAVAGSHGYRFFS